ncbi:MAG: hypothetical protein ACYC7A_21830 [Thermoanaerobaculia bacterium]
MATATGGTSSRERLIYAAALAAITALAARGLSAGLAPPSLWVDDLWPAVLAGKASLAEIFAIGAPVSPIFLLLLRAAHSLIPSGDLGYQLVAFVAGLAGIPLVSVVAHRATGSRWLGVAAAALLAANPLFLTYSLRVKQFTLEALAVALLLAIALREDGESKPILLCIVAALLTPLAFTTLFLSIPLCALVVLRQRRPAVLAAWVSYAAVVAISYATLMAPRSNEALAAYWQNYYLPGAGGLAGAAERVAALFTNAFPAGFGYLALLAIPGAWHLARSRRDVTLAMIAMYGCLLATAAAGRFPVGTGRTEIFTFPVTIVLTVAGAHWLTRRNARVEIAIAVACAVLFVARAGLREVPYLETNDRAVVELANRHVPDGDAMVVYPFSTWAVAHYGRWPVGLRPDAQTTVAYYAIPRRERTLVLEENPRGIDFRKDPAVVESQLEPFLESRPPRVWLVATSADPLPNRWIVESFRRRGYVIAQATGLRGAGFALFVRPDPRPPASPPPR